MFSYWKKVDELNHINRLLLLMVGILSILTLVLIVSLAKAPNQMRFWLTPTLMSQGGEITAQQIPKSSVYSFVATMLPLVNSWSGNEEGELNGVAAQYHYYFTQRHRHLLNESIKAYKTAQLFKRTQTASLYKSLDADDVKQLAPGLWEVHVQLRLIQRLNDKNPLIIADKVVDYHIRVAHVGLSYEQNPFELALDGYSKPERLLHNLLEGETREKV